MATAILHAHSGESTDVISEFQAERRAVSNRIYTLLHALVTLLTGCSVCIAGAYAWGLGEGIPQSAILTATAVGIEVALVFFAAVMYPRVVMAVFGLIAGVGVLLISVLTITSFLLSQQHQQEHGELRQREEYRAGLVADKAKLDISNLKDRGSIAILNNRIESVDEEIQRLRAQVPQTKSTAIYHYIAKSTGYAVESVSLALRGLYGLIVVCTAVALAGYLETVYSPKSLSHWLESYEVQHRTIEDARQRFGAVGSGETRLIEASSAANERYRRTERGGEVSEALYDKVRCKVEALPTGEAVPVHSIRSITKRQPLAYACVDRLLEDGLLRQSAKGRYLRN